MAKTQVYWNLHKKLFSVRQNGKIIAHMGTVVLEDVTLHVQPAGRERVRREGKKNVHAYASGTYQPAALVSQGQLGRKIIYNPYKHESFVYADDLTPVRYVDRIVLTNRNIWELI